MMPRLVIDETRPNISRSEWLRAGLVGLVAVAIFAAAMVVGFLFKQDNEFYTGLRAFTPGDYPIYYAAIRQVADGAFTIIDPHTGEQQGYGLFNIVWFTIGIAARVLSVEPIIAFHGARMLVGWLVVMCLYRIIALFFDDPRWRLGVLIALMVAGGAGTVYVTIRGALDVTWLITSATSVDDTQDSWPVDMWVPEATTINNIFHSPHIALSLLLNLSIATLLMQLYGARWLRAAGVAGLLGAILLSFHPYYAPQLYAVLGVMVLLEFVRIRAVPWRMVGASVVVAGLSGLAVLYHMALLRLEPVLLFRSLQNVTPSPSFVYVLVGYGALAVGGALGLRKLFTQETINQRWVVGITWMTVALLLAYGPFQFQRRYLMTVHFWLVLLSAHWAWYVFVHKGTGRWRKFFITHAHSVAMLSFFVLCSTITFNIVRDFYGPTVRNNPLLRSYYYIPRDYYAALNWLDNQQSATVLWDGHAAVFVPAFTPHQVYLAHGHETIFFAAKNTARNWYFFAPSTQEARKRFLVENNIAYVVYTGDMFGQRLPNVQDQNHLDLVFDSQKAKVYRVIR